MMVPRGENHRSIFFSSSFLLLLFFSIPSSPSSLAFSPFSPLFFLYLLSLSFSCFSFFFFFFHFVFVALLSMERLTGFFRAKNYTRRPLCRISCHCECYSRAWARSFKLLQRELFDFAENTRCRRFTCRFINTTTTDDTNTYNLYQRNESICGAIRKKIFNTVMISIHNLIYMYIDTSILNLIISKIRIVYWVSCTLILTEL